MVNALFVKCRNKESQNKANYGALPIEYCGKDSSKIVIIPVPYDKTSTWIKGTDKAPQAIIAASANMELYDIETNSELYKQGIFTEEPINKLGSPEKMIESVRDITRRYIKKNKFVVVIGGEHSVSIGSIKAHAESYDNLCVLQLDAHSDLRDNYNGSKYNHACVMARVKEICPIVQVGIRSMDSSELKSINKKRVFFAEDIQDIQKNKDWVNEVVKLLSDNVYITLDLDVFDPSIMPSVGTPEPGGLLWYEILSLLKAVIKERKLVGFDVVELCPVSYNKAPDFLASKLIYKALSYKFKGGNKQ